jgi:DNA-binding MarR family transcriptional regulator
MPVFDVNALDDVIHGRIRLGAMSYLVGADEADFTVLREHLATTDGNLSAHLRKLESAGYVSISKSFRDRKPLTRVAITEAGRTAFVAYLDALSRLIAPRTR